MLSMSVSWSLENFFPFLSSFSNFLKFPSPNSLLGAELCGTQPSPINPLIILGYVLPHIGYETASPAVIKAWTQRF